MFSFLLVVNLFINPEVPHAVPVPGGRDSRIADVQPGLDLSTTCALGDYAYCQSGCVDREPTGWVTSRVICGYDDISHGAAKIVTCDCFYVVPWTPINPGLLTIGFGSNL